MSVTDVFPAGIGDVEIFNFARQINGCIVTFDQAFIDLSMGVADSPKIILLRTGNILTEKPKAVFQEHKEKIFDFFADPNNTFLEMRLPGH
ncbi:MAG: DUF5615 family PIN-like protein [Spirochaetia bacterium]|nr:DUF5615 family PIN-like protein [Spirochaetia bacterium]